MLVEASTILIATSSMLVEEPLCEFVASFMVIAAATVFVALSRPLVADSTCLIATPSCLVGELLCVS